ncbi:MAG: biotin/lipoyl-binding protein [Deltaproteobacteria bacterium]
MTSSMPENTLRIALLLIAAFLHLSVFQAATSEAQEKGSPAALVKVAQVTQVEIAPQVQLIGTAQPKLTSIVASDIEGIVEKFDVSEGDFVKKGAVLAHLEDSLLRIELRGAQANKADTEAQLSRARADLRCHRSCWPQKPLQTNSTQTI